MGICPFKGTVEVARPPLAMSITLPFHVPAVIVPKEALPNAATPVKVLVPETVREVMLVVVKVPWPMLSILGVPPSCRAPAEIFKLPPAKVEVPVTVKSWVLDVHVKLASPAKAPPLLNWISVSDPPGVPPESASG